MNTVSIECPVCGHINHLDEDEEKLCEICDSSLEPVQQDDYEAYQEWRKVLDEIPF